MPKKAKQAGPFTAFAVQGPLDFSLVGVLATLLQPIADAEISVLTISTFDTDWLLVPVDDAERAAEAWRTAGHEVVVATPVRPERAESEQRRRQVAGPNPRRATTDERHPPHGLHRRRCRGRTEVSGDKPAPPKDMALVVNTGPDHSSASVFTANRCKANPILWSEKVVEDGIVRAVVLNSGGANCYTGAEGFQTTHAVAERVAERLGIGAIDVVVCSTGLIGLSNPRENLLAGVDDCVAALAVTAVPTPPRRS